MTTSPFGRVITAMVTPMTPDGAVDTKGVAAVVEHLVATSDLRDDLQIGLHRQQRGQRAAHQRHALAAGAGHHDVVVAAAQGHDAAPRAVRPDVGHPVTNG